MPSGAPAATGDVLVIHEQDDEWWVGEIDGKRGNLPVRRWRVWPARCRRIARVQRQSNYVKIID